MKVKVKAVHSVFAWSWQVPGPSDKGDAPGLQFFHESVGAIEAEDDDDVCGICRASYNATCPSCKYPGDRCPIVLGACTHNFHVHCIEKWLDTSTSRGLCPMCRQVFSLLPNVRINDAHRDRFSVLLRARQQEQEEDMLEEELLRTNIEQTALES